MCNPKFSALLAILILLSVQSMHAQCEVVVIPMAGDDVAMAQQNFRYDEETNITGFSGAMCMSDVFNTPGQATQVFLVGNASARIVEDTLWSLNIQFSKDVGTFTQISPIRSYGRGGGDRWSQLSTTDILDLDPNSSYQFRLLLNGQLTSGFDYCDLTILASYKLPTGKSILEVSP